MSRNPPKGPQPISTAGLSTRLESAVCGAIPLTSCQGAEKRARHPAPTVSGISRKLFIPLDLPAISGVPLTSPGFRPIGRLAAGAENRPPTVYRPRRPRFQLFRPTGTGCPAWSSDLRRSARRRRVEPAGRSEPTSRGPSIPSLRSVGQDDSGGLTHPHPTGPRIRCRALSRPPRGPGRRPTDQREGARGTGRSMLLPRGERPVSRARRGGLPPPRQPPTATLRPRREAPAARHRHHEPGSSPRTSIRPLPEVVFLPTPTTSPARRSGRSTPAPAP